MPRIVLIFQLVYLNSKSTDWTKIGKKWMPICRIVTHHVGLQTGWNLMPIKSTGMGGKTSTLVSMRAVQKFVWGFRTASFFHEEDKKMAVPDMQTEIHL